MTINQRRLDRLLIQIRRKLSGWETGLYQGFFGAEGFDIHDIKPYEIGDSLERVHVENTALMGELMVWDAEPEVALRSGVVVDLSASMFYGTDERSKFDVAIDVATAVSYVSSRNGNRFGALLAGKTMKYLMVNQGSRHVARLFGLLANSETSDETPSTFANTLSQYNRRFKQRGLAVVISDFLGSGWEKEVRKISRKHTVLCVRVIDKIELELEDVGVIPFEDPMTGEFDWYDTSDKELRDAYATAMEQERIATQNLILGSGAEYFELRTDGADQLDKLIQQLNRRNQRPARGRRAA